MSENRKPIVPIKLVVEAIERTADEWRQFLDIEKMEIVSIPDPSFGAEVRDDDIKKLEEIEEGWNEKFFELPTKHEIHDYRIVEEYVQTLPTGHIKDRLQQAIHGKGAFSRFKNILRESCNEQDWYNYRNKAYERLAIEWCKKHGLQYIGGTETHNDPLAWVEVKTEHIVQDEWIDFRRSAYRFPDGNVFEPYYSYSRRDYVVIVATDEKGNYLCVRQFRHGIKQVTTEFPAGGIERKDGKEYGKSGDASAEDALEAAKRELLEETGYVSDYWRFLLRVPSNATIADNYAYLFEAKDCHKVSNQELDETEFLNVSKLSEKEIESMINEGEFQQAMHIAAWLMTKRK